MKLLDDTGKIATLRNNGYCKLTDDAVAGLVPRPQTAVGTAESFLNYDTFVTVIALRLSRHFQHSHPLSTTCTEIIIIERNILANVSYCDCFDRSTWGCNFDSFSLFRSRSRSEISARMCSRTSISWFVDICITMTTVALSNSPRRVGQVSMWFRLDIGVTLSYGVVSITPRLNLMLLS